MDWTWYLFRFDGRINRAKLWLATVHLLMMTGLVIAATTACSAAHLPFGATIFRCRSRPTVADWADCPALQLFGTSLRLGLFRAASSGCMTATRAAGGWCRSSRPRPLQTSSRTGFPIPMPTCRSAIAASVSCLWGFVEMYCLKRHAQDQPVRAPIRCAAAAARHAAALGPAERDRNGAAQGWPAAGLAC